MNDHIRTKTSVLDDVLSPYKPGCRYLRTATVGYGPSGVVEASGEFCIPESCYIADTGHFNAVEFNICYNQIAYVMFAEVTRQVLVPQASNFGYERFKEVQLGKSFIVKMSNQFKRPIDTRRFFAKTALLRVGPFVRGVMFLDTSVHFFDEDGGEACGNVLLACVAS